MDQSAPETLPVEIPQEEVHPQVETEAIQEPIPTLEKPKKRVLTEAQRLAFMKAREKRQENIQKRKALALAEDNAAVVKDEPLEIPPTTPFLDPETIDQLAAVIATKLKENKAPKAPRAPRVKRQKLKEVEVAPPEPIAVPTPDPPKFNWI